MSRQIGRFSVLQIVSLVVYDKVSHVRNLSTKITLKLLSDCMSGRLFPNRVDPAVGVIVIHAVVDEVFETADVPA